MATKPPSAHSLSSQSPIQTDYLCRRVTATDLRSVTPDDIDAVMRHATSEQLKAALAVMVERNRYGDIYYNAEPETFSRAVDCVTETLLVDAQSRVKNSPPTQSAVLATLSDSLRDRCGATLRRIRAAAYGPPYATAAVGGTVGGSSPVVASDGHPPAQT